jgi:5-formyltetrahydrofolate cyclo-ligase
VSARICGAVVASAPFARARHVVVYAARPGEIDAEAIADAAVARVVSTYYPRVDGEALAFCEATRADLVPGAYGIPEPSPSARRLSGETPDILVIVPGLAFDRCGSRLGSGLGYYDRTLSRYPTATRIGIAAHDFVVDALPVDAWDVPMHAVVTERGLFTADGCVGVQSGDHS